MIQYFNNLLPGFGAMTGAAPFAATKTLQNIYSGVDVWPGRGQYGDGGFCCYRAITHTAPLQLSTAIFAPGWTWESATEDPEKNWNTWWDNERKLWLGPLKPGDVTPVPPSPEGPFKPMTAFFQALPPSNPSNAVFYTSFSPGVGYFWFVEGKKVLDTRHAGWTDIDKQSSIGNLTWPWPAPTWEGNKQNETLPTGSTTLDMTDGYNGGNTLKLALTYTGSEPDDTVKSIWLPVQSLPVTTRESFEARVTYKTIVGSDVDLSAYIYAKSLSNEHDSASFAVGQVNTSHLSQGWTQQTISFKLTSASTGNVALVAIGFLVNFKPDDPSTKVTFTLSLGQLAVYPTPPPHTVSVGMPSVINANFALAAHVADTVEGVLTWDTASTFTPANFDVENPESAIPAWRLQDTPAYRFPTFVYFNIYAASLAHSTHVDPASAVFIGTTGLDGRANRLYVDRASLPAEWDKQGKIRFYIQGVTDRGEVLPWERCATVDMGKA